MGPGAHRDHPWGKAAPCPIGRMDHPCPVAQTEVQEISLMQMEQVLEEVKQLSCPWVGLGSQCGK